MRDRKGRGRRKPAGEAPTSKGGPRAEPLKPTTEAPPIETFREWPLAAEVQDAIEAMGITKPTPVQKLAIGPVLEGRDVIAKAETGTGKTLAFGAPMMSKIESGRSTVLGLVLCPTRELAQQVCGVLEKLGASRGVKTALVVGGEPMPPQIDALKAGAQVVVGTPGRVIDLYGQRFLSFPWTEFVVLDEADEMLEIGFIDDVRKILSYTPEERQTLLFSATYPTEVLKLARESTRNPVELATAAGIATVKNIDQSWVAARREDRALLLTRIIEQSASDDVFLVFCDRRTEVDQLFRQLGRLPFSIKSLHGGYDQAARFRVMSAFRTGEVKALIATDVAARGLDVHQVTHVINYAVPRDASTYTHRIGRTGRAGRDGTAITIVGPEHVGRWHEILRDTKWEIREEQPPDRTGRPRVFDERSDDERSDRRDERRERRGDDRQRTEPRPARTADEAPREQRAPRPSERGGERPSRPSPQRASAPERESQGRSRSASAASASSSPSSPSNAQAPLHDRPRREMSTRERMRLEREQGAGGADQPAARQQGPARQQAPERPQAAPRQPTAARQPTTTRPPTAPRAQPAAPSEEDSERPRRKRRPRRPSSPSEGSAPAS